MTASASVSVQGIHLWSMNIVSISAIILFFVLFLGKIILTGILRPALFPVAKEKADPIFQNINWLKTIICLSILYGPFLAGFYWAWHQPSFMVVAKDGEWSVRNPYYVSLYSIASDTPRWLEVILNKENYSSDGEEGTLVTGSFWIHAQDRSPFCMQVFLYPTNYAGDSVFLQNLGLDQSASSTPGIHGGIVIPWHTFTGNGPVMQNPVLKAEAE